MKSLNRIAILGGLTALFAISSAAVIFDATSGTGFVGKGDVQLAFGWNNKDTSANQANVSFNVFKTETIVREWDCVRTMNNGDIRTIERNNSTKTLSRGVVSNLVRDNKTKNVTGYQLTQYGSDTVINEADRGVETSSCVWPSAVAGDVRSETFTEANLFVTHNGTSVRLAY
jgi:hypothetical protein